MDFAPSDAARRRSVEPAEPPAMGVMGGRESLSTHMVPPGLMVVLRVVLPQQVLAVVVAVGRADDRVDVIARRLVVGERDAALVIELDQDDRAVNCLLYTSDAADERSSVDL